MAKKWTSQEVEYLEDSWGRISFAKICKKLDRSSGSVSMKAQRLGLGAVLEYTDYLTAKQLANALGVCGKTVVKWIKEKGLNAKYTCLTEKRKNWLILINDFWKWAENNKDSFNAYKIEENILGPEPKWLKEKRKEDYKVRKQEKKYTAEEDAEILRMYKICTAKEIAKALGRTDVSVRRRAAFLGVRNKAIEIPWTSKEAKYLVQAKSKGRTFEKIADDLGRSYGSVTWKYRDIIDKGLKASGFEQGLQSEEAI